MSPTQMSTSDSCEATLERVNVADAPGSRGLVGVWSGTLSRFLYLGLLCISDTVDERNPAPPGMYKTLQIMG